MFRFLQVLDLKFVLVQVSLAFVKLLVFLLLGPFFLLNVLFFLFNIFSIDLHSALSVDVQFEIVVLCLLSLISFFLLFRLFSGQIFDNFIFFSDF